jgi:TatA/E family protein of Tat protein translocase
MLPVAFIENPLVLVVVLFIAILLFGHKLPSVAKSLGSSVSEFKKGVREGEAELNQQQPPPAAPVAQPPAVNQTAAPAPTPTTAPKQ